jgi:hypothetical protein
MAASPGSLGTSNRMAHRPPFKKDITPIGRGGVNKFTGKGAREQMRGPDGGETLTSPNLMNRMTNNYPKPAPPAPAPMPTALPPATAPMAMPPGEPDADDLA